MGAQGAAIRLRVNVRCDPGRAFRLFVAGMGTWWPLELYSRAVNEDLGPGVRAERLHVDARAGGAITEHLSDGRPLPWGEIVEWDPPHAVVFAWKPHSLPEPPTELGVAFAPTDDGTAIQIEHRGWERVSDAFRDAMYDLYVRGWPLTLERFVAAANQS